MKGYIKPEDLPEILDEKTTQILAEMANEVPQSREWHQIFDLLTPENLRKVLDKRIEIQTTELERKKSQMTEGKKKERQESRERTLKKLEEDPHYFLGNMSRPDTPEEHKYKFGVWPDGTSGETYP